MSFSFGFGQDQNDGIEEDHPEYSSQNTITNNVPVELFTVEDLMDSLPERMSFEEYNYPDLGFSFCRRELFDLHHQLMAQDGELSESEQLFITSPKTDIKKGVYEGGLKTWEGAFDLIECLGKKIQVSNYNTVIELGCGSGLPSIFRILKILKNHSRDNGPTYFTLADFNLSVLKLFTLPNLVLSWAALIRRRNHHQGEGSEKEFFVTNEIKQAFLNDLKAANVQIRFLSGPWAKSDYFHKLQWWQHQQHQAINNVLVLASETIYSLDYLNDFIRTLQAALTSTSTTTSNENIALVAGKKSYFGVGGGVIEFTNLLAKVDSNFALTEMDFGKQNDGVKRFVLKVSLAP